MEEDREEEEDVFLGEVKMDIKGDTVEEKQLLKEEEKQLPKSQEKKMLKTEESKQEETLREEQESSQEKKRKEDNQKFKKEEATASKEEEESSQEKKSTEDQKSKKEDEKTTSEEHKPSQEKTCREDTQKLKKEQNNPDERNDEDEELFLGAVGTAESSENRWCSRLKICGQQILLKVDTGADVTVISEDAYKSMKWQPKLEQPKIRLKSASGELKTSGSFETVLKKQSAKVRAKIFVVPGLSNNLLSRSAAEALGLVKFLGSVEESLFGFGLWQTQPVTLKVMEDAKPYAIATARTVPIPMRKAVEETLQKMEQQDIITKVTKPTEWCAPMVPVAKPKKTPEDDLSVRICVDYKKLNACLRRESFQMPVFEELTAQFAGAAVFSKLDAAAGFFQIPLSPESQPLTTFMTPFGRYMFKRLPMGCNIAPEVYQRKVAELLEGLEGVAIYMDDVVVYGDNHQSHDARLKAVLDRMQEAGLKLNREKCKFRQEEVEFLGHNISKEGVKITDKKNAAIQALQRPENKKELQSALGMINYLTRFVPGAQTILAPLNELLKDKTEWRWDHQQEDSFNKIKKMIATGPVLAFFNPALPTVVAADSSSYGLGAVLLQEHGDKLKPVAFCSRMLTATEQRWAQIEKECLASVWACEKFHQFVCGLQSFRLQTDHKPLVPLINSKDLQETPVRCQRLLMRLMRYSPVAEHVPGRFLITADFLSRHPVTDTAADASSNLVKEVTAYVEAVIATLPATSDRLKQLQAAQLEDPQLAAVIRYTKDGWPDDPEDAIGEYYHSRGDLSVTDDMLLFRSRIVVPPSLQSDILQRLHEGHGSLAKGRERAKSSVWWPTLSADLKKLVERCSFCQKHRRAQKAEPMTSRGLPERPWQRIGVDLCDHEGKQYLVTVDYFSRWIEVEQLAPTTSAEVIRQLKSYFSRFGIPEEIRSDGGPQFASAEFSKFCEDLDIRHTCSDPYCPQGNGAAERAVQVSKRILAQEDPVLALLAYHSTPVEVTGHTPAQLLMGRNIRSRVPTPRSYLAPHWPDLTTVHRRCTEKKMVSIAQYNRRHGAAPLPALQPGDIVRSRLPEERTWSQPATVIRTAGARSYQVTRNRRHLQQIPRQTPRPTTEPPTQVQRSPVPPPSVPRPAMQPATQLQRSPVPPPPQTPRSRAQTPTGQCTPPASTRSGRVSRAPARLNL